MDKTEILTVLNDWNFWTNELDTGIRRSALLKKLLQLCKINEIIVVKGIRRSGKSTLLLQFCEDMIKSGVRKNDILIINFEDPRLKNIDLDLLNKMYEVYLTELDPKKDHYVILDEVQVVIGWERFARYLHENKKVRVFVTGSSSKLLSSEYSTVLSGRHVDLTVKPLSFSEYLEFIGIKAKTHLEVVSNKHKIIRAFSDFQKWGGFPKTALLKTEKEKSELLKAYFKDIIVKDIIFRYKLKETEKLEELAKFYLDNISTLQSYNKIKNVLKLSLDTVERFSQYLCEVYMLTFVKKFSYSRKEQILNPKKVYCADIGLRTAVAFVFLKNLGKIAENIVFNKLIERDTEIYYWKGKREVDFLLKKKRKISEAIQVCWDIDNENTKKREVEGILEACKTFGLKFGTIVTSELSGEETIGGIKIKYVPMWAWLLGETF